MPSPTDNDVIGDYDLSGVDEDLDVDLVAAAELAAEGAEEEAGAAAAVAAANPVLGAAPANVPTGGKGALLAGGVASWGSIAGVGGGLQSGTGKQGIMSQPAPATSATAAMSARSADTATNGGVKDAKESNGSGGGAGGGGSTGGGGGSGGGGGNRKNSGSRRVSRESLFSEWTGSRGSPTRQAAR